MPIKVGQTKKITNSRWLNLFSAEFDVGDGKSREWQFVSRKASPRCASGDASPDGAIIVPFLDRGADGERGGPAGERPYELVVIRQFRVPINADEISFPAGLADGKEQVESVARRELKEETGLDVTRILYVSPPVISSAGLSDESLALVFVECTGQISVAGAESSEQISVLPLDYRRLCEIMDAGISISAKTWPFLFMYRCLGRIEPIFPDR